MRHRGCWLIWRPKKSAHLNSLSAGLVVSTAVPTCLLFKFACNPHASCIYIYHIVSSSTALVLVSPLSVSNKPSRFRFDPPQRHQQTGNQTQTGNSKPGFSTKSTPSISQQAIRLAHPMWHGPDSHLEQVSLWLGKLDIWFRPESYPNPQCDHEIVS
jgi:hypothetical protein